MPFGPPPSRGQSPSGSPRPCAGWLSLRLLSQPFCGNYLQCPVVPAPVAVDEVPVLGDIHVLALPLPALRGCVHRTLGLWQQIVAELNVSHECRPNVRPWPSAVMVSPLLLTMGSDR